MSTTSTFFNNFDHKETQRLLDSLVVESIRIYGQDCYYLPRRRDTFDEIYSEDDTSYFDSAYSIPMYVKTAEGFINPEALLTNFGLEIRPQVVLSIARFEFDNQITSLESVINRPREGDLVYFPLNKRSFQINFVDDKPFFYQHGKLQMYDCTCELYEYSNERFETSIEEIDEMYFNFSFNAFDHALVDHNGLALTDETGNVLVRETLQDKQDEYDPLVDNDPIETESDREGANTLIDWSENNPFSEGRY